MDTEFFNIPQPKQHIMTDDKQEQIYYIIYIIIYIIQMPYNKTSLKKKNLFGSAGSWFQYVGSNSLTKDQT